MILARFQDEVVRALYADDPEAQCAPELAPLFAQPGFAVYRNTVVKACIDALQANYPAVCRLVGEEWFRAAAAIHARQSPPRQPTLACYGDDFAEFLAQFPPAAELPYLADVARLDRHWTQAHVAVDGPVVDADEIAALSPQALAATVLRPHSSARWAWFESMPIRTIWRRNRDDRETPAAGRDAQQAPRDAVGNPQPDPQEDPAGDIDWRGEGVLIVRPVDSVDSIALDAADCGFLDACARGRALGEAAAAAMQAQPDVDLALLMRRLLVAGAFGRIEKSNEKSNE